jgi:predicted  nucleic acid-binding Zn-ribbon protein
MDGKMSDILERLENFSLYSYPPGEGIYHLGALQRAATAEIERLRADKDVLRSQQRNAAYERDIAALEAEIERLRAALNNLDACAVPTAEQIEQMEKGIGAIYTPAMALRLGMETAIGNVKRAMAALEQKSP